MCYFTVLIMAAKLKKVEPLTPVVSTGFMGTKNITVWETWCLGPINKKYLKYNIKGSEAECSFICSTCIQ